MSGEQGTLRQEFLAASEPLPTTVPTVLAKPTIAKLNFNHEAIIQWLLQNPGKMDGGLMGRCAEHFGYSRSWLSIIIHSDAFQAKWREMQDQADALILSDIPAKLRSVASTALDGLADQVEAATKDTSTAPRDFLLRSSDLTLKALGYGAKPGGVTINNPTGPVQVNHHTVGADALSRAREKLVGTNETKALPAPVDNANTPS